ncbi:MAG: ADYC domain-containing protein [Cyanobacteria bacterium J06642_2]
MKNYSRWKATLLASIGGTAIAGLALGNCDRFTLQPISFSGSVLQGNEIAGVTLTSFDDRGRTRTLKITDVQLDPQDATQEIYLYTVLDLRPDGQWQNFCLADPDGVAKAIPLSGRWDSSGAHIDDGSITFACTNGALAKCVRWGYKPWQTVNGQSLQDYHQACTRMVRADYCGNGIGHTRNGTPIDVYDRLSLYHRTPYSGMTFEAAWDIDGAVFFDRPRFPEAIAQLQAECPEKLTPQPHLSQAELDPRVTLPEALLFNDSFLHPPVPAGIVQN